MLTVLGARPGRVLPPLIRVPGASPSQELKCCADGKAEKSGPISAAIVSAVFTPIVGIAVRSTPNILCKVSAVALSLAVRLAFVLREAFDLLLPEREAFGDPGS